MPEAVVHVPDSMLPGTVEALEADGRASKQDFVSSASYSLGRRFASWANSDRTPGHRLVLQRVPAASLLLRSIQYRVEPVSTR